MKILLISPCHKNFGGWYRAYNIAQALRKRNHKVKFVYNRRYYGNAIGKILTGIRNAFLVALENSDVVHVFELVQPESMLAVITAKLLRRKLVLDVGDEWTLSPTSLHSRAPVSYYIRFLDLYFASKFRFLTVTSDYLRNKYVSPNENGRTKYILKLINGVNKDEYEPVPKRVARKTLGFSDKDKIILAFGNTYGGQRQELLDETCEFIRLSNPEIQIIKNRYLDERHLPLYVGACDLFLFPTGDSACERACFPIRVGTYLNGERVIATDETPTEFHNTLKPYNCLLTGKNPLDLALNIVCFFYDIRLREYLEKNTLKAKESLGWNRLIGDLEHFYTKVW